jgi:DNA-binding LacI/PurR family transcriptional regulator
VLTVSPLSVPNSPNEWPAYNLTTIHQPAADIIITAVELLLSIVDETDATAHVRLFNCKAIERGTLRRVRASSGTG